ncbi:Phosphotransferase enzyme [Ophidiomyces ophidiicola]|nr:Phosphotransferase enzyme [Ophidiomyces ophidiicola]
MDFTRSELDIPVPKVLAWHSRAAENQVGAEYIIMEKAAGSCLSNVWPNLNNQQKRDIIQAVIKLEVKFLSNPFGGIGSLANPKSLNVSLPDNFDELNEEAKKKAKKLRVEQSLYKFYDAYSALLNKRVYQALGYQQTLQGQIVALIGTILLDAEPAVQALLMELATKWNQINSLAGTPCSLEYSNEAVGRNR